MQKKPTLQQLNIDPALRAHLEVRSTHEIDDQNSLVLVRTKETGREDWIRSAISKTDGTAESINEVRSKPTSLDEFDSGVVFLVSLNNEDTVPKSQVVCRSHDFPFTVNLSGNSVRAFMKGILKDEAELREWYEGTIVRVFTLFGKEGNQTFVSTRSKIDCSKSKVVQLPDCPTILEMFNKACESSNLSQEQLKTPGQCHCFVLMDSWNQLRNKKPVTTSLLHFASYSFSDDGESYSGKCVPIKCNIEGALKPTSLTEEQATEIILAGGVVMTNNPTGLNYKYMTDTTNREYGWLRENSGNPVMTFYALMSGNTGDLQAFLACLQGWFKEAVDVARRDFDKVLTATVEYLYQCHVAQLRNKNCYQFPFDRNSAALLIIKGMRSDFHEAKKAWFERPKTAKPAKKEEGKVAPKFIWGGNFGKQAQLCRKSLRKGLTNLMSLDGAALYTVVRDCRNFKKREDIAKARSEAEGTESLPIVEKERQGDLKKKRKATHTGTVVEVKKAAVEEVKPKLSWGELMDMFDAENGQ